MRLFAARGLDIAVAGKPFQAVSDPVSPVRRAALLGADLGSMRTELLVAEGERVAVGSPLLRSRQNAAMVLTSPVSGRVGEIVIGARRRLGLVAVEAQGEEHLDFAPPPVLTRDAVAGLLLRSGLWPALRARPFDRIADPSTAPAAIVVMRADTRPHAPDPAIAGAGREEDFCRGVAALAVLTEGPVVVCDAPGLTPVDVGGRVKTRTVEGPHPAGLPGTQIARLAPLTGGAVVWHAGHQDVAAIGRLMATGTLDGTRVISLSGPGAARPRLLRVPSGAHLQDLLHGEITPGQKLVLSGSALDGRESGHLGRYHQQVSVLDRPPAKMRNWLAEALHRASRPAAFIPTRALDHALARPFAVVPLLRAISVGDTEAAARLGCLMLAEEDMALATYVTGGGVDFGVRLRVVLDALEEGA